MFIKRNILLLVCLAVLILLLGWIRQCINTNGIYVWGWHTERIMLDSQQWDRQSFGVVKKPSKDINIEKVKAGHDAFALFGSDGSIEMHGSLIQGNMRLEGFDLKKYFSEKSIVKLAFGLNHILLVDEEGSIFVIGDMEYGQVPQASLRNNILNIANPPIKIKQLSGVRNIAICENISYALLVNGDVYEWGSTIPLVNNKGFPSVVSKNADLHKITRLKKIIKISGCALTMLALSNTGKVFEYNIVSQKAIGIKLPNKCVDIACGFEFSLALLDNGDIYAWGDNSKGQLGNGTLIRATNPVKVNISEKITSIAIGYSHCLALSEKGELYTWGAVDAGKLSNNKGKKQVNPVKINAIKNVKYIGAGDGFSLAVSEVN